MFNPFRRVPILCSWRTLHHCQLGEIRGRSGTGSTPGRSALSQPTNTMVQYPSSPRVCRAHHNRSSDPQTAHCVRPRCRFRNPSHHGCQDVAVQHAGHRHALGSSFHSGYPADGFDKRFAVVFSRAPDQRAVNVEQDECIGWFQASTIASSPEQPGKGGLNDETASTD